MNHSETTGIVAAVRSREDFELFVKTFTENNCFDWEPERIEEKDKVLYYDTLYRDNNNYKCNVVLSLQDGAIQWEAAWEEADEELEQLHEELFSDGELESSLYIVPVYDELWGGFQSYAVIASSTDEACMRAVQLCKNDRTENCTSLAEPEPDKDNAFECTVASNQAGTLFNIRIEKQ